MDDTGESAAAINQRADDACWSVVLPMLQAGATLRRVPKLRRSYVDGHGGISDAGVRRRIKSGDLVEAGLDQFALATATAG